MRSWLITGGAGFIGCHFVRNLASCVDDPIIVIDAMTYAANTESIQDLVSSGRVKLIEATICNPTILKSIFVQNDITHVVHFAAESHVDKSINGPEGFIHANVVGTFHLLETARSYWSNLDDKLFFHISTDEVYGALSLDDPSLNETAPYRPNSPYAASKAASNHLVAAWHKTYGLPVIISACCNNFGSWQHPEKFLPVVIMNTLKGRPIPVYGDGLYVREWIHVDDHCDAIMMLIDHGSLGQMYNIGSGDEQSNINVSYMICDAVDGIKGLTGGESRKLITFVKDRPGHDRRYSIDSSKIRSIGWTPKRRLAESITDLIKWYQEKYA